MPVVVPLSQCIARPSLQGTRFLLTEHLLEVALRRLHLERTAGAISVSGQVSP